MAASEHDPVVLGLELGSARGADRERAAAHPDVVSPLEGFGYDLFRGEYDLTRLVDSPVDDAVEAVVTGLADLDRDERERLRHGLSMGDLYTLLTFARRSALRSLRSGVVGPATAGLDAIGLVDLDLVDHRDVPEAIALVLHAIERAGADPDASARRVAASAPANLAELLGGFVGSPVSRDLAEWGLQEVETARGVGLIRREGRFRPTVDIASVGLGLADVIDGDRYRTTSVQLDRHMPSIWFHESARDEVERIQRRSRAGANIHARARPDVPQADAQQFTLFLLENRDAADAATLAAIGTNHDLAAAALVLSHGALFLLLVARSYIDGAPPYETTETLERFREPFNQRLRSARPV